MTEIALTRLGMPTRNSSRACSHLELIVYLRAIAIELAAHPKFLLVIPDAAGEMWSDKFIARGANCAVADQDVLVGNPVCADTENAAMLSVNHGVLLQT